MEQRIGTSSQPLEGEPLKGAGFDPAFIPGLTSPTSPEAEGAKPEDAVGSEEADETEKADEPETVAPAEAEVPEEALADEEVDEEEAPEGPVFEASDRRAKIIADHRGVRLSLDDQECEFRWDEIGAVETESPRFGKRFTITVHTPERRWYPVEIEAASRSRFKEWEAELDAVLDAYFEDGDGNSDSDSEVEAEGNEA